MKKNLVLLSVLFVFSFVSLFAETAGKWSVGYSVDNILNFNKENDRRLNDGNISGSYWFDEKMGLNFDLGFDNYKEYLVTGHDYYNDPILLKQEISLFKISLGLNNIITESGKFRLFSNENIYYEKVTTKYNGEEWDRESGNEFGITIGLNAEYFVYQSFSLALRADVIKFCKNKNDHVGKNNTEFELLDTVSPTLTARYYF